MWKTYKLRCSPSTKVFHYTEYGIVPKGFFVRTITDKQTNTVDLLCVYGTYLSYGIINVGDYIVVSELGGAVLTELMFSKLFI